MTFFIYNFIILNVNTYYRYFIKKNIKIQNIVTIEYLDINKNFQSEEETHPFSEIAYVDSGAIICVADGKQTKLNRGELYFFLPNTPHYYITAREPDTKLFIICANCKAAILDIIGGKNIPDDSEKKEITDIFSEAKRAFRFPFDKKLIPLETSDFGAQQLTEAHIEILLTKLIRKKLSVSPEVKFVTNSEDFNDKLVGDKMLKSGVYERLDLSDITKTVHYCKTYINRIFKQNVGTTIMHYYYRLKTEEAKKLLNKGLSINEISDLLCYDNPNYFAKAFKASTGMTPSKYRKTIYVSSEPVHNKIASTVTIS